MSERIDHAKEAREWIEAVMSYPKATSFAIFAQAEATLALVEQQRVANLIALMESPRTATSVARVAERALMVGEPVTNRALRPDIAAALGIGDGDE